MSRKTDSETHLIQTICPRCTVIWAWRNCSHVKIVIPGWNFRYANQDRSEAVTLLSKLPRLNRPWIGIHAGARPSSRRWPAQYFAAIADELAQKYNAQIILTGSADEKEIVQAVETHMKIRPLNLAGETSLGGLAALISELDLFVSNDTGPAHIANALRYSKYYNLRSSRLSTLGAA